MQLHVLAGCHALLRPAFLDGTQSAGLIGERVRAATAFWLSSRCGRYYHDFLRDSPQDLRVKVFATSLMENFGSRFEPLVVLPEFLEETANGPAAGPAASGNGAAEPAASGRDTGPPGRRRTAGGRRSTSSTRSTANAGPGRSGSMCSRSPTRSIRTAAGPRAAR